jgi:ABC-2 type transport system ATP-binding protein
VSSIVARALVKRYGGVLALDQLSFEVPRGSICAVIGPNGCGKTTTFGLLAGLLAADAGRWIYLARGRSTPHATPAASA